MKRSAALLVATAATALVAAAVAVAEPDHTTTLNATTTEFKWDGNIGAGVVAVTEDEPVVPCDIPGHTCDELLIKTDVAGGLTVKTEPSGPNTVDVDLRLYKSDASGAAGATIASDGNTTATESVSTNATAGSYYLARVEYAIVVGGSYTGVATLKPRAGAPAGGGAGGGSADAPPTVGLERFGVKMKRSQLKGFSGNASDDKGVSRVELAISHVKGKKCRALNSRGKWGKANCETPKFLLKATGSTKWSLKLSKKAQKAFKKGGYIVYARSVDSGGQQSAVASQRFKITG